MAEEGGGAIVRNDPRETPWSLLYVGADSPVWERTRVCYFGCNGERTPFKLGRSVRARLVGFLFVTLKHSLASFRLTSRLCVRSLGV